MQHALKISQKCKMQKTTHSRVGGAMGAPPVADEAT